MDRADEILYNYCPELQLVDMLDWLNGAAKHSLEIPELLAADSSNAKTVLSSHLWGPTPDTSAPSTQSL